MVLKGKSGDVAMKGLKVCVYLLILYSKIAIILGKSISIVKNQELPEIDEMIQLIPARLWRRITKKPSRI